jgi:xylulokinase
MFIGLDVGTSEVKALLLTDDHRLVGTAGVALAISRPQVGHSEQNPADWWQATLGALEKLRARHAREYAAVRGIGLSGQMHGAVLLDAQHQVLRPAILWNDTRAAQECVDMMREYPDLPQLAGSLVMPGFTAPKLRWVARHEPAVFAKVATVLLPKDYIRYKLTGDFVTDLSDASGTAWLDVAKRAWSLPLLALTGLSPAHMPRLVEGSAAGGVLRDDMARQLGLASGVIVAGGGGDNAASAVGMGAVEAGQGFLSLGTSGVLFVVTPSYQPNAASATHAFCHALPGRWHQMSVMLSAASCLHWATRLVGASSESEMEIKASTLTMAERAAAPLFLPYLSGERTPHNSASVRGSLHGLDHDTHADSLAYAVIEGVTFGLTDGLAALRAAGSDARRLSLVGGGAKSAMWAQQLASCLDLEIVTHGGSTAGGALGAARLAWLACAAAGVSSGSHSARDLAHICPAPDVERTYTPNAAERAMLLPRYERFRALYRDGD